MTENNYEVKTRHMKQLKGTAQINCNQCRIHFQCLDKPHKTIIRHTTDYKPKEQSVNVVNLTQYHTVLTQQTVTL